MTDVHEPHIEEKKPRTFTVVATSSITQMGDSEFTPYNQSYIRSFNEKGETELYPDYEISYLMNPYTSFVVDTYVNSVWGNGFYFVGNGAEEVEEFMRKDNTRAKMKQAVKNAVIYGDGLVDKKAKSRFVDRGTRVIDPYYVTIQFDMDPKSPTYGEKVYYFNPDGKITGTKIKEQDRIWHLTFKERTGRANGTSLLRSSLFYLTSLLDTGGDMVTAMKRVAYAPILIKLDLEGYSEDEKEQAIDDFKDEMKNVQSSMNNYVFDKRHEIGIMGTLGGGAKAQLLPVNDLVIPLLSIVLSNFGIPLASYFVGEAKNGSEAQQEAIDIAFDNIRAELKDKIEREFLPWITDKPVQMVWKKGSLSSAKVQKEVVTLTALFDRGIVSKEYVVKSLDIVDDGRTFNMSSGKVDE